MGEDSRNSETPIDRFRFSINDPDETTPKGNRHNPLLPTVTMREFGRITVILGINGSGKSRLLKSLAMQPVVNGERRPTICVEGGRALYIPSKSNKDQRIQDAHSPESDAKLANHHNEKLLNSRVKQMLALIEVDEEKRLTVELAALRQWQRSGGDITQAPKSDGDDALKSLSRSFSALFPNRRIDKDIAGTWTCQNGQKTYDLNELSDGEKQVLCLLGDVGQLGAANALIVIDEPELNLHPSLAILLWNIIEEKKAKAVFVYATHCLSFAMRPSVTDLVILGEPQTEPIHLTSPFDWSREDLLPFLGAIPAVITSRRLLVAEGDADSSFDKVFYRWVCGPTISIANVGSCDRVLAAVKKESVWSTVGDAKLFGVVDRDYKPDWILKSMETCDCMILPYHEAESYLCYPQLIADAAKCAGKPLSVTDATDCLREQCRILLTRVSMRRTISKSEISLNVGKEKGPWPKDRDEAAKKLRTWAKAESGRAEDYENFVCDTFDAEFIKCESAINDANVENMLTLFPGKEIIGAMSRLAGLGTRDRLLTSVTWNLRPEGYPPLIEIRKMVMAKLS